MDSTEKIMWSDLIFHLEKAIENDEFVVYYQPIIHTISGSLCGFEALVRWQHPRFGFLLPGQFVSLLEEAKQIWHLDVHLVRKICQLYQTETKAGRPFVPVSVNLSRHDFSAADMLAIINRLTAEYGMPRNMLNIEVTESAFAEDERLMSETLRSFRSAGYQVWMDDFGSGYSSLNTLKDYEFDELKIDMKFMSTLSYRSRRIIASIVSMAKYINMVTLVEGVETHDQIEFLKSIGCDRLQGYYFSKPLPYAEVVRLMSEKGVAFETESDRRYYHDINRINLLSPSPFNLRGPSKESHGGGIPLAIIEEKSGNYEFIYQNDEFTSKLEVIGAKHCEDAIQRLSHFGILDRESIMRFLQKTISDGEQKIQFSVNGDLCCARAKRVSGSEDRCALLLSITNITQSADISHEEMLDQRLKNIYSLYLRVSVLRPEKNEMVTVFSQDHLDIATDIPHDMHKLLRDYCRKEVAPDDRRTYTVFTDPETLEARIRDSHRGFINTKLHTLDADGSYSNKMYLAVAIGNHEFLLLVRYANL